MLVSNSNMYISRTVLVDFHKDSHCYFCIITLFTKEGIVTEKKHLFPAKRGKSSWEEETFSALLLFSGEGILCTILSL